MTQAHFPAPPGTDHVTAQMCRETGHSCSACATDARDLYATAHNALGAVRGALAGTADWGRAKVKLGDLERAVSQYKKSVDAHFGALDSWQRP